jgi:hypothetical protein
MCAWRRPACERSVDDARIPWRYDPAMRRQGLVWCVLSAAGGSDAGGRPPDPDANVTPLCQPVDAHPIAEDAVGAGYALLWSDRRDRCSPPSTHPASSDR